MATVDQTQLVLSSLAQNKTRRAPMSTTRHIGALLIVNFCTVLVAACIYQPEALQSGPEQLTGAPTATSACLPGESSIVCRDRLAAEKLPPPPPAQVSGAFQTSEAQYLLVLTQQALTPQPPPATPEPILWAGTSIPAEDGTWIYRGASAYQPRPLFEVSFEEAAWRLDRTRLISHAIDGCELELLALGEGMLEAPRVTFTKLGDFDAEVRAFREAAVVSYGIGIGNYYYSFLLHLPKNSAEAAAACQLAAESVLSTFRLVDGGQ